MSQLRLPHPPCEDCGRSLDDLRARAGRGLRRPLTTLATAFDGTHPPAKTKTIDHATHAYRDTLFKLLDDRSPFALCLFFTYDPAIPPPMYQRTFEHDEPRLTAVAADGDLTALTVVLSLARRLRWRALVQSAHKQLALALGQHTDAWFVATQLDGWRAARLLDDAFLTDVLRTYVIQTPLQRDPEIWSSFLASLPPDHLPPLFEVRHYLGWGAESVRLANTPDQRRLAVDCCLRSSQIADVDAGIELAERIHSPAAGALRRRAADLLFAAGRYEEAADHYRVVGRPLETSVCYERLGRFRDAVELCPAETPDRAALLAARCLPEIDQLAERREFAAAVRYAQFLRSHLDRMAEHDETASGVGRRRREVEQRRQAALTAGRRFFGAKAREAASDKLPENTKATYSEWSRFEEEAGALAEAGRLAEAAEDHYRAHRLYSEAGQFGQAERVMRDDDSPGGLATRAASLEAGGDLLAAARLREEAGQAEEALALYVRIGEPAEAARCLLRLRGNEAVEDPRLAAFLRQADDVEQLVRLCVRACAEGSATTRAAAELRLLRAEGQIPLSMDSEVTDVLNAFDRVRRGPFEARAQDWATRALKETAARFAGIWGLDLGTTTCAVAIYDTRTGRPVLCPWKGSTQFASTLSVDVDGVEKVGLAGEEILGERLRGYISGSKRRMGSKTVFRIRDKVYSPQEVASRLVGHARRLVEDYLAARVVERIGELALAELGEVPDEWLAWAAENLDARLVLDRAVVTVPAYFSNNQTHATRDACEIAKVQPVRLLHEPTAAAISIARQRELDGRIVVVDLGAGTLDLSFLEVGDNVFDVQQVAGNNAFGGQDFDQAVQQALVAKLEQAGVSVPSGGQPKRRLAVAAEYLKVSLSTRRAADYTLVGFVNNENVRLELNQAELAQVLASQMEVLRKACTDFRAEVGNVPDFLVLVGGPMLAEPVRDLVEDVFQAKQTIFIDPRALVATGAAIQAAVLDRKIDQTVLLDITPFPLGIRAMVKDRESFSVLVVGGTTIPTCRSEVYTTHTDNQTAIKVEIFNGSLDTAAKIGQFDLEGIPAAPRGQPKIEVTFEIDASCVLQVTARDLATGLSKSISVKDTTLLSPREHADMARRFEQQRDQERRREEYESLRARMVILADDADREDAAASFAEFEALLAAYRPTSARLNDQEQRALAEVFNPAVTAELEMELRSTDSTLRDVAGKAREYLNRPRSGADGDSAEVRYLVTELDRLIGARGELLDWLRRRRSLLRAVGATDLDPLEEFRRRHASGDYFGALTVFGGRHADNPLDLELLLHCVAEAGDSARYRRLLADSSDVTAMCSSPAEPGVFLARAERALVRLVVPGPGGRLRYGTGFLVSDQLIVTNRSWLADPGTAGQVVPLDRVRAELASGPRTVNEICPTVSSPSNLALLRLAEPAAQAPFRLGYSKLLRIGDPVWAVSWPGPTSAGSADPLSAPTTLGAARFPGTVWTLPRSVVEKFEHFPEHHLQLIKIGLGVAPESGGGPLFNDLGEVVGVLTVRDQETSGAPGAPEGLFAVSVDSLSALLKTAGFDRFGAAGR